VASQTVWFKFWSELFEEAQDVSDGNEEEEEERLKGINDINRQ